MKKALKIITILITTLVALYSIAWFATSIYITKYVTDNYGDREIPIPEMGNNYSIFFRSANVTGFPFALGVQLSKFRETSNDGVVEYKNPVEFGYNLRTTSFYRKFNGTANARLRPIHSHIGSIVDGYSYLSIKYPLTKDILNQISALSERQKNGETLLQEDYLPLLRGLKNIEFVAENIVARDIANKAVIYESPASYLKLEFAYNNDQQKFYLPSLSHLPSNYKGYFKLDIQNATEGKQILVNNMMFGLMLPAVTNVYGEFNTNIDLSQVQDFDELNQTDIWGKILTKLDISKAHARNDAVEFNLDVKYVATPSKNLRNMAFKSSILPRKNFKNDIIEVLAIAPATEKLTKEKKAEWIELINKYYTTNPDKISFDLSLNNNSVNIDKLAIDLKDMGVMLQIYTDWDSDVLRDLTSPYANFQSRGRLSMFNFNKLIDTTVDIAFDTIPELKDQQIMMFKQRLPLTKEPVQKSVKKFARLISQHPESNAVDVIVEYEFDNQSGLTVKSKNLDQLNKEFLQILMQEMLQSQDTVDFLKQKIENKLQKKLKKSKIGGLLSKLH